MFVVRVLAARGLTPSTPNGVHAIGCSLSCGSTTSSLLPPAAPAVHRKETNPTWNKTFYFNVENPQEDQLSLQVIDRDDKGTAVTLGAVHVPVCKLRYGQEFVNWFKLENGNGEINLGLLFQGSALSTDSPSSSSTPAQQPAILVPGAAPYNSGGKQDASSDIKRAKTVGPYVQKERGMESKQLIQYNPTHLQREFPQLARGGFGIVFKGRVPGMDGIVVIKDLEVRDQKSIDDWTKEVNVMAQTRSPYIAEIFGYCSQSNILTIVMEFFPKGDLFGVLHKHPEKHPLSLLQRMRMARHTASGVAYLHEKKILHRDIKSMNVLVTDDYSCKLTDFGCAKAVGDQHHQLNTIAAGTPLWMAPEVKVSATYGLASDIYSLGLVLYELFERKLPFYDQQRSCVVLPPVFQSASIVIPCLANHPDSRPNAENVLHALDATLKKTCKAVADFLPAEEKEKVKKQYEQELKEQQQQQQQQRPQLPQDPMEAMMLETYRYLLSKNPTEVDALIQKAFAAQAPAPVASPVRPTPGPSSPVPTSSPSSSSSTSSVPPSGWPPGFHQSENAQGGRVDSVAYKRPRPKDAKGLTQVIIKSARGVKAADMNGKSDPYCKIVVDGSQKYKTQVKKETLNPDWDYVLTFPSEKKKVVLDIEVWDKDVVGKDFLGMVHISLDLSQTSDTWHELQKRPNKKDKGIAGKLQVIVE